jgi:hypothetical protein
MILGGGERNSLACIVHKSQAICEQCWIACGDGDRLLPGIERLKSIIPEERLIRLSGGHTWEVWTAGFSKILAKTDWNQ